MRRRFSYNSAIGLLALVSLCSPMAVGRDTVGQDTVGQAASAAPLFSFAVVSDLHVSEHDGPGYFTAFIQQINTLPSKPDFVLVTGDIHVSPFQKVFDEIKPSIPFHVVAGNHETRHDRDVLAKMFPDDFQNGDFYSFTHKGSFFIGLCDASTCGDHVGHFESEHIQGANQGQWLEEQLTQNSTRAEHVFIFAHIPPNPAGNVGGGMSLASNDQKQLRELVLKYKPVALFFGHLHGRQEFTIGESPVYVLPSLNWNGGEQPRGFLIVNVFKSAIATEFVALKYPALTVTSAELDPMWANLNKHHYNCAFSANWHCGRCDHLVL